MTSASATVSGPSDEELLKAIAGKKSRWGWVVLLVLLVGAGAAVAWRMKGKKTATIRYLTARVSMGEVIESIEATGTVQPVLQVTVGAQVSGRVLRLHTDFNARVHRGELLAELDPEPFQTRVNEARASEASARAQLARARADLAQREREFARARELRTRGLNAQAEMDQAIGARELSRASVTVAQAEISRTLATLANARTQLTLSRILSPIDGVVISRQIEPGQTVVTGLQAPVLFVLAEDLTRMRVMADVDEADIGRMREGMTVEARVDAFPGKKFRGRVTELRYGPTTTAGVVTYPAVIEVPNPDLELRPGMTATVVVTTARIENAMRVTNAALRYRPAPSGDSAQAGGRRGGAGAAGAGRASEDGEGSEQDRAHVGRVFVLRDGRPARVRVRTGVSDGSYTVVESSDLRDGTEVVTDEVDEAAAAARPASGGNRGGGRRGGL
ncbi:MAG: efflux RND transporter periplasmic adaptor subunit [Deltaproteobacteria bacterium]|nr:efflux RND transporter periplasmic adaptor subunit [Deltaproteobacteria bacterium]